MSSEKRWLGRTYTTTRSPWGLFPPTGHRLLCSDGVVRAARLAPTADSYYSVPASIRLKGKSVSGYLTTDESGEPPYGTVNCFRHHDTHKEKLPSWPSKFTPEHTRLMVSVYLDNDDY